MANRIGRGLAGAAAAGVVGPRAWAAISAAAAKDRLNVLLIMSDQHNVRAMGCSGNPQVKTPHLDRLAAEGVRFSHATCQTGQCCPSRATLFTGRYAHSHGCRWNGVTDPVHEVYFPEIFKAAGYATATIGKHHFFVPAERHGFDTCISMPEYNRFCRSHRRLTWLGKGKWERYKISGPVGASAADNDHHPTGYWANEMIKWLGGVKDKPFCGVLSFFGPHTPICPSKPWAEMYDPDRMVLPGNFDVQRDDWPMAMVQQRRQCQKQGMTVADHRRTTALYYGLTSQIDHNIGRVLTELDRLKLADRTLVIYTADHGELMGEHRCWTKTVSNYDATTRVPMILRLPGRIPAGKVRDELVGTMDIAPTILRIAGQKAPEKVQGNSMVPLLNGEKAEWRQTVFSEIGYPGKHHGRCVMARTHKHKYIHNPNLRVPGKPIDELFDLAVDPWETTNRAGDPKYADVLARLKKEIADWDRTTDHAPMYPITHVGGRRRPQTRPAAG